MDGWVRIATEGGKTIYVSPAAGKYLAEADTTSSEIWKNTPHWEHESKNTLEQGVGDSYILSGIHKRNEIL